MSINGNGGASTNGSHDITEELRIRVQQQAVIADLGMYALSGAELQSLMDEAVRQVANTLDMEYCKVLELLPGGEELLLKAGVGWREGLVGVGTVGTDLDSQAGFTLRSKEPVIVTDLRTESRFRGPPLLVEHGVVSGMSVIIHGPEKPYGVLGTHTTKRRSFTRDDIHFIQAVANIIGEAVHRRRTEQALREAHDELEKRVEERTAKLNDLNEELEAFAYSVSHDLRTPLRGIDGFSRALAESLGGKLNAEERHFLERIRAGVARMGEIIDDLLMLSHISQADVRYGPVDVSGLAREVVRELQTNEPARRVSVIIEEGLVARADAGLLRIALENLLLNAWKFTRERTDARIELRSMEMGGDRVFSVSDNGVGFNPEYADKLFTPFGRLHQATEFEGSGIGLTTVQRVIHKHGGRIWAEGEAKRGATFYFTLGHP